MISIYNPWCNTCGIEIEMAIWNDNDGECDKCKEWWKKNSPDYENYGDDLLPQKGQRWPY